MFKKYFYLIRHGETILNKEHKRQDEKGKLSPLGEKEIKDLSKRLSFLKIDKMFISPYERTLQTAEIINQTLKLKKEKLIITDYLKERRNPTCIIGKEYDDPVAKSFIDIMDKSIHEEDLRIYDEENFLDLKIRAINTQKYLIKNGGKKNICVTHGYFLKMFLSTILYQEELSVKEYIEMNLYNVADNAGMTLISYNPVKKFLYPFYKISDFFNSIFYSLENEKENNKFLKDIEKEKEEDRLKKEKIKKYSPWEIIAYNDSSRGDGLEKMSI